MRFHGLALLTLAAACTASPPPRRQALTAPPPTAMAGGAVVSNVHPAPAAQAQAPQSASQPPAPAPPPYDLASDLDARQKSAKEKLGRGTVTRVVGKIFVVVAPPGWGAGDLASSISLMDRALAAYMNKRFDKGPAEAITVYLFPRDAPYGAFCRSEYNEACISPYGFYEPTKRAMIMNAGLGLGTLTHELVHPLVEADFPEAPAWINEGIASVFEAPVIPRDGEIHGVKNWRLPRLKRALAAKSEHDAATLDALFGMSDDTFRGAQEDLHYATARYVCQWLDDQGKLWPFYRTWRDNVATDPSGRDTFTKIVGKTPEEANVAWEKWARNL